VKVFLLFALVLLSTSGLCAEPEMSQLVEAAKAGNSEAMYAIFFSIVKKSTPEKPISDIERQTAAYWLIKAGESKNFRAANVLALCYEKGCFGVPVDPEKARYFKKLAEPAP